MTRPLITTTGLDSDGVKLIGSGDPQFPSLISKLVPSNAPPGTQDLLRYAAVIHNATNRSIILYSGQYTFTKADGSVTTQREFWSWNLLTGKGGDYIMPGDYLVVSHIPGLGQLKGGPNPQCLQDQVRVLLGIFEPMHRIEIALDAVVFSDGQLVGPDRWNAVPMAQGILDAELNLCQEVITMTKTQTPQSIVDWLGRQFKGAPIGLPNKDAGYSYAWCYRYSHHQTAQLLFTVGSRSESGPANAIWNAFMKIEQKQHITIHR